MRCALNVYPFVGALVILLILLTSRCWQVDKPAPAAKPPRGKREPKPCAGSTHKPECELCEHGVDSSLRMPDAPPPRLSFTRGRHRQIDTQRHSCPQPECAYHGWVDFGNIRANGHPNGRRWRQLVGLSCPGYFLETHSTPLHGKPVDPDQLVWAMAALAEGLGIRAVARVFETAPNTVLRWLVEAAEHLEGFSRYFLGEGDVEQVQMDELFALLRAVKDGQVTESKAIPRLARSPHWVWTAMAPGSKLMVAVAVGPRPQAMAHRLVQQVTQVWAPEWAPLLLTDGFRA